MVSAHIPEQNYRFSAQTEELAFNILALCRSQGMRLATAESCTAGLIAAALTEINGFSDVFWGGIVSYANEVKRDVLNVSQAMLDEYGAVSEPVARAMAEGALKAIGANVAVSVTGIAGPAGGSPQKPVGLVHMAVALYEGPEIHTLHRVWHFGDRGRSGVREATVNEALKMVHNALANIKYVA